MSQQDQEKNRRLHQTINSLPTEPTTQHKVSPGAGSEKDKTPMTYRNLLERIRNLICLEEQAGERCILEKISLETLKNGPQGTIQGSRKCLIWAGDGGCYWKENCCGYTGLAEAGIFSFEDAYNVSHHCGPEKGIEYHFLVAASTFNDMLKAYFTQAGLDWREILPKEEAGSQQEGLREALLHLRNEVSGSLHLSGVREAIGNTNFACLETRIAEADVALSMPPSAKTAPPEPTNDDLDYNCAIHGLETTCKCPQSGYKEARRIWQLEWIAAQPTEPEARAGGEK